MGYLTASSCFLYPYYTPYSSPCSSIHPFLLSSRRNLITKSKNSKNRAATVACLNQENPRTSSSCARRAILFMGFAVIPILNIRAQAIDAITSENTELRAEDQKQKVEQSAVENPSPNPFFSLLNTLGFLGSGVLAGLYALAKQEKATSDATIESMNAKLKEKEAAITSLEKKFESELLNEKEARNKALAKANEEKQTFVNQLKLANDTVSNLGKELQKEKRLVEELTAQVGGLSISLQEARDEKKQLQEQLNEKLNSLSVLQGRLNLLSSELKDTDDSVVQLNSKLAEKERELEQLRAVYQQSQDQVTSLSSEIVQLKDLLVKNKKELELKNKTVDKLNGELNSSISERDDYSKKLDAVLEEYNHYKSSAEEKLASDAKILGEREEKIHRLEAQLHFAQDEVKTYEMSIDGLTKEKDKLREKMNAELENVKNLEGELKTTQDALEKSKDEASDLAKQLNQSRSLYSRLVEEVSKVRAGFKETRELLQKNIDEAKQNGEILAGELKSAKELLSKSDEELQNLSQELAATVQKRDNLEKELVLAHEKAKNVALELKEEKKIVYSLNNDLKVLETQISKDKEARKGLEADLEEATKSLDEMNKNALMLSRDLELANSTISSLEDEKDALHKSLDDQKRVSQEARENLEDAHSMVMKLGKERETLESRGKKLEEELASAKGEILRLRSQIYTVKTPVNDQKQENVEVGDKAAVPSPSKKVTRRRRVNNTQRDDS